MRYAQNSHNFESTASYATCWSDIDWKKTQKYVDKQRFRIFRAEHESNNREKVNQITLKIENYYYLTDSEKGLFEPDVVKATRPVLKRVQGRNPLFLSDQV